MLSKIQSVRLYKMLAARRNISLYIFLFYFILLTKMPEGKAGHRSAWTIFGSFYVGTQPQRPTFCVCLKHLSI
jgi:hypothetical protein